MNENEKPIIKLRNVRKFFGATKALESVSFDFYKGNITAIVGANGAGKSTLIKIICGYHKEYEGKIYIDDELVKFTSPDDAYNKGIQTVHQIINQGIISNLTVYENLVLKDLLKSRNGIFVRKKDYIEKSKKVADLMGIEHSKLHMKVEELSQSDRQLIIIARALSSNPKLLILDEPTAAISERETDKLFEKLLSLKNKGVSVLYVSHRLHEIKRIADNVVVIRDGVVSSVLEKPFEVKNIVKAMTGENELSNNKNNSGREKEVFIETKDLVCYKGGSPLNIKIYKGQILSIVGLIGAGKTEFGEILFGIRKPLSGKIFINGRKIRFRRIKDAIKKGIHFVPEDRNSNAIFPNFSITENITIPFLKLFSPNFIMSKKKEKKSVLDIVKSISLKYESLDSMMDSLSGGNQQKVIVSRWLFQNYNLVILDEPFQGVDIKSRFDIGRYISENIGEKAALILVADIDECIDIADRIIVFNHGKVVGEAESRNHDRNTILHLMSKEE